MSKSIILKLFKVANIKVVEKNNEIKESNYDLKVIDESFYDDVLTRKTLGFGEAYMAGKFTTSNLEILLTKLNELNKLNWTTLLKYLNIKDYFYFLRYFIWKLFLIISRFIFNAQSIVLAKRVAKQHYDLPSILYQKMLGPTMLYSCGYWNNTTDLNVAQQAKIELIAKKLKIKDGDEILEIGSGWGHMAYSIAKSFPKAKVLGITISMEQLTYAHKNFNLPNLRYELRDYRELKGFTFDKIYSVGMFEHVGPKNYDEFFNITYSYLKPTGIMLLHTICRHQASHNSDPWIEKYIFPGGHLPSMGQVVKVSESTNYILADIQEFGLYYATTLDAWYRNVNYNYSTLRENSFFDEKFRKLWEFYLIMSKVGFTTKNLHLAQFVFTKNYETVYQR